MPIDDATLQRSALFKLFWETSGDADLPDRGLNELSPNGARKLHDFALKHEVDGKASAAGAEKVDDSEKAIVKKLLEHDHYSDFMELDGRVTLANVFGVHDPRPAGGGHAVVDEGDVSLPARISRHSTWELASNPSALPQKFTDEYGRLKASLESNDLTPEERSMRTLGLLRDYAEALWARGESPQTEAIGQSLLDAFERTHYGRLVGNKTYNGAPWSIAQGLVLGVYDPNSFETKFPDAKSDVPTTYLNMSNSMAKAMRSVDDYREALGLERSAEAHELRPVLNWMIGEAKGHHKPGSLDERRPFSSSGVNWGIALFRGDDEVRNLPVKAGFEFPLDVLDGLRNFVPIGPGDHIQIVDREGHELRAEKVIEKDADGKAVSWSARFVNPATGAEVGPQDVLGLVKDARGKTQGDGKGEGSANMGWWGFCDRNTAQKLYKAVYGIPQLDLGDKITIRAGGRLIEVPLAEAQSILDMDVPDLIPRSTFTGFRFNDEPVRISLNSGETVVGRINREALATAKSAERLGGDSVVWSNLSGTVKVQTANGAREIDAAEIAKIAGETENELSLSNFLVYVSKNKGMYATDSSTGVIVSNGMRWTNSLDFDVREGDDRPDWAGAGELKGLHGALERVPGDRVVFARGMYKAYGDHQYDAFSGWLQLGKSGRILNEGFIRGEPDFAWGGAGDLEWAARSSFNSSMEPEMRLALLVNGVKDLATDGEKTDALAKKLNLPASWREHRAVR